MNDTTAISVFIFLQKDEMTSGKVLELICVMKRKDNRTFNRFVEVLDRNNCTAAVDMLRHKKGQKPR